MTKRRGRKLSRVCDWCGEPARFFAVKKPHIMNDRDMVSACASCARDVRSLVKLKLTYKNCMPIDIDNHHLN